MREMTIDPREQRRGDVFLEVFGDDAPNVQRFIRVRRDEPAPPPLPLAQGSVVYAQIGETWGEWFLTQRGTWTRIEGFAERSLSSAELHDRLTRFHVISEPRALTAYQLLARVVSLVGVNGVFTPEIRAQLAGDYEVVIGFAPQEQEQEQR